MRATTPAPESSTRLSCPHPPCARVNRPGEGPRAPRWWTGTHTPIARRRCPACDRACSARAGPRMAGSQLPADTLIRRRPWQRWGGCEAGTAALGAVALHTVQRLQHVAAQRAETHHRPGVGEVDVPGVQGDAAHAKLRPRPGAWSPTALAMGRWLLRWVDGGPRPQAQAAALGAPVVARVRALPLLRTDGWKAESAAWRPGVRVYS